MSKIVANFFISLDGVVQAPNEWHFPYFDDAMGEIVGSSMAGASAMLMGRTLYDEWSEFWPQQGSEVPFSDHINNVSKYVVTHRGVDSLWNNTAVITGDDAADQVRAAKDRESGDIAISGSATTVRWLLREGLLDEIALLIHPIAVGKGQRLFEDTDTIPLTTVHSETLPSGVLFVRYAPAR